MKEKVVKVKDWLATWSIPIIMVVGGAALYVYAIRKGEKMMEAANAMILKAIEEGATVVETPEAWLIYRAVAK